MFEFSLAGVTFLVLVYLGFLWRRGGSAPAQPATNHEELVKQLDEEEMRLAYNETVTGITIAGNFSWSTSRVAAEADIAASLYVQLQKIIGEPITTKEMIRRRNDLLALGLLSLQEVRKGNRAPLYDYPELKVEGGHDIDSVPDRERVDEIMHKLQRLT